MGWLLYFLYIFLILGGLLLYLHFSPKYREAIRLAKKANEARMAMEEASKEKIIMRETEEETKKNKNKQEWKKGDVMPLYNSAPLTKCRYYIEQEFMRDFFFERPKAFLYTALEEEMGINGIWESCFKEKELEYPYQEEDFKVTVVKVKDNISFMRLDLPQPEAQPLCYRVYFFFDPLCRQLSYYLLECGERWGKGYLGEWHRHLRFNFGEVGNVMNEKTVLAFEAGLMIGRHVEKYGLKEAEDN